MSEQYDLFDRLPARDAGRQLDRPRARPRLPEVFEHPPAFAELDIELPAAPPARQPAADPVAPAEAPTPAEPHALVRFLERSVTHRIEEHERPAGPVPVALPQIVERLTERVVEQPVLRPPPPPPAPGPVEVVREREVAPRRPAVQPVAYRWHATGMPPESHRRTGREPIPQRRGAAARQEPVVQISIGRLEVTAAGAGEPATPTRERPGRPQAMVSLEDFLARENGGDRG